MKIICVLSLLGIAGSSASPANSDYVNFVRQIDLLDKVEWDVSVPAKGSMSASQGVGIDGALFELWSIHDDSSSEYLLDEAYVDAYLPGSTIEIITGDPYKDHPRTRVDQPFSVRLRVDGLVTSPDYVNAKRRERAARENRKYKPRKGKRRGRNTHPLTWEAPPDGSRALFVHDTYPYPKGKHSLDGNYDKPVLIQEAMITENGETILNYPMTNIRAEDLTRAKGEEVFTITSLAGYETATTILATAKVQIWPIARGVLSGFDPNEKYNSVPPISMAVEDLYPYSTTFVRVYSGGPVANPAESEMVIDSYFFLDDSIPRNRSVMLTDNDRYFGKDGLHTVEIVHRTPFGLELLDQRTILVDRKIEMRGSIYSSE